MSEKPQESREDDILDRIITQELEKLPSSQQTDAGPDAPPDGTPASTPRQEGGGQAEPPASKKSRRSAVYLYLLILFVAAFLMLLLAYFVQQRSSENAISDLRDSMNLSREELLDQVKNLEEQNAALEQQIAELWVHNDSLWNINAELGDHCIELESSNTALNEKITRLDRVLAKWLPDYDETPESVDNFFNSYYDAREELCGWEFFWTLEQYYRMGDLKTCAELLVLKAMSQDSYPIPDAVLWRYDEIVPAVIDAGYLKGDYSTHPEDYSELMEGSAVFTFDFNFHY